jgi:hypothetical protein
VITPDSSRVVFVSDRDGGIAHLFSVPLMRLREDPDDPLVKERLRKARPERREQGNNNQPQAQTPPSTFKVEP